MALGAHENDANTNDVKSTVNEPFSTSLSPISTGPLDMFAGYDLSQAAYSFKTTASNTDANKDADPYGTANPSIMNDPFWKYMIYHRISAWDARSLMINDPDERKAAFVANDSKPVWSFKRFGSTQTRIPDGRVVCIGGEHEDYYDPDF